MNLKITAKSINLAVINIAMPPSLKVGGSIPRPHNCCTEKIKKEKKLKLLENKRTEIESWAWFDHEAP